MLEVVRLATHVELCMLEVVRLARASEAASRTSGLSCFNIFTRGSMPSEKSMIRILYITAFLIPLISEN